MDHLFRTPIQPQESNLKIDARDGIFTIGSCFSDAMGTFLHKHKFEVLVNPFGTIFNPTSIFKLLSSSSVDEERIVVRNDAYYHYDFHSALTGANRQQLVDTLESAKEKSRSFLANCQWLIITFGTAMVYKLNEDGSTVANCHKLPQALFTKTMLTLEDIQDDFARMYGSLHNDNEQLNIILTVSPVRHTRDGLQQNSLSKALLRVACHNLSETYDNVHYFPSYEIVMDDLRDYRFYKPDMIHPNETAEEYIWDMFQQTYFDQKTKTFIKEWGSICNALNHKPFRPDSEGHQKFLRDTLAKLASFSSVVDTTEEEKILKDQLV